MRAASLLTVGAVLVGICGTVLADDIVLDNGRVRRVIACERGHVVTRSYRLVQADREFVSPHSEFSIKINDRYWRGAFDDWRDVTHATRTTLNGGTETTVTLTAPNGTFRIGLSYTLYPGLALVRKQLTLTNLGASDLKVEHVSVEDLALRLNCINSMTYRRYARTPVNGPFVGNWEDMLVVAHDFHQRCGVAIGNEEIGVLKRVTTFHNGFALQIGTTRPDSPYPFRRWLRTGESWTSAAVFTAPYANCDDPQRVVHADVSAYVRKYMGTRVTACAQKPTFVYNTWLPFLHNVNETNIRELAEAAAQCGVEEFVIDSGWQYNPPPNKGIRGDYVVDPKKFPHGLKPVFDHIRSLGMKPGLWFSFAWAEKESGVLRAHPEWICRDAAGNPVNLHTHDRNFATACLGTDWSTYIRDRILSYVRDYNLGYAKIDLAIVTSAYVHDQARSGCCAKDHPGHRDRAESFAVIYSRCMEIMDDLHRAAPDLFIDCTFETAGKIHLMDYGIARHADGNWLSNLDPIGTLGSFNMRTLAWQRTPAIPATSLVIGNLCLDNATSLHAFRSLAGTLPIMLGDPRRLTPAQRAEFKTWATWLRGLETRHGIMSFRQDLPGFGAPTVGAWDGFGRINDETRSGGLVGVFREHAAEASRVVTVPGLNPDATYAVTRAPDGAPVATLTGRDLAAKGFSVTFTNTVDSALFEVARQFEK